MVDLLKLQRQQKEGEIQQLQARIQQRKREGKGVTDLVAKIKKLEKEIEALSALPIATAEAKPPLVQPQPPQVEPTSTPVKPEVTRPEKKRVREKLQVGASDREYRDFFGLCTSYDFQPLRWVRENGGLYFLPLGFVPGKAVVLHFGTNHRIQIKAATLDVEIETSAWLKEEELPQEIRKGLQEREALIQGLGYEPDPWTAGKASALSRGKFLGERLTMAFSNFQWKGRTVSFGVLLGPRAEGVEVIKVYNPGNLSDAPNEEVISLSQLSRPTATPLSKIIFTWVKMERACHERGLLLRRKPKAPKPTP